MVRAQTSSLKCRIDIGMVLLYHGAELLMVSSFYKWVYCSVDSNPIRYHGPDNPALGTRTCASWSGRNSLSQEILP